MKKTFLILLFLFSLVYSQEVGFGIGFSPYDMTTSSITIKFEEDYVYKILCYFKNKLENFFVERSSTTQVKKDVNFEEIKKIFYGFGKS